MEPVKIMYALNEHGDLVYAQDAWFIWRHYCVLCGALMVPVAEAVFDFDHFIHDPDAASPEQKIVCPLLEKADHADDSDSPLP